MQCPDCGYYMSDLDSECLRCKRLGKPKVLPTSELPVALPASAPNLAQASISMEAQLPPAQERPQSNGNLSRFVIGFVGTALLVIILLALISTASRPSFDERAVFSQAQKDCAQGYETNCQEEIRQLNDHGYHEDAKQAEATLNIAHYLDGKQ